MCCFYSRTIRNEIRNGMTRPLAYVMSNTILQIPLMWIMVFLGFCIPMYAISNFNAAELPLMITIIMMFFWSFECMAQMFSLKDDNFLLGHVESLEYVVRLTSSFLVCGVHHYRH